MHKDDLLNKLRMAYDLTNNIHLRNLMVDTIKQDLTELVNNLDGKMITFTYFQKKLNNLVLTHYKNKGDISFMFDIIPNLDIPQREKEQIDIKGKLKKLFKETDDLKQRRKYVNSLIYLEYLKELDKHCDNLKDRVIDSNFNKSIYKQIKAIENIPLTILNPQIPNNEPNAELVAKLYAKLDEVINERVQTIQ